MSGENALPYDEQPHGLTLENIDAYATSHSSWKSTSNTKNVGGTGGPNTTPEDRLAQLWTEVCEHGERLSERLPLSVMCVGKQEAQVLHSLVRMSRATRVLELGTFSGVSTVAMAAAAVRNELQLQTEQANKPPWEKKNGNGAAAARVVTVDNWSDVDTARAVAQEVISAFNDGLLVRRVDTAVRAAEVIEMKISTAMEALQALGKEESTQFDFVFVDADKEGQIAYFEELLRERDGPGTSLLSPRGMICVDNTLWYGKAAQTAPETWDETTRVTHAFNEHVLADKRVETTVLTVRDGLSLIQWR